MWEINGKAYLRYGASRVWAAKAAELETVPAVLCGFGTKLPAGFTFEGWCNTPAQVLLAFRNPRIVGYFECSHEMIDAHRLEP